MNMVKVPFKFLLMIKHYLDSPKTTQRSTLSCSMARCVGGRTNMFPPPHAAAQLDNTRGRQGDSAPSSRRHTCSWGDTLSELYDKFVIILASDKHGD